jgi:hypothetical protein
MSLNRGTCFCLLEEWVVTLRKVGGKVILLLESYA